MIGILKENGVGGIIKHKWYGWNNKRLVLLGGIIKD